MRAAEAGDWVRKVLRARGNYPTYIERVSISDVSEIGDLEIPFSIPITTLCGPNGVGKSVILKSIYSTLDFDNALLSQSSGIPFGEIEVTGVTPDGNFSIIQRDRAVESHGALPSVTLIDCGAASFQMLQALNKLADVAELLAEVDPLDLNGVDLDDVRYIACRDYRTVKVYEVDIGFPIPFFEVSFGDVQYDSRTMGMGELSGLTFWWHLRRAVHSSILLIEEPEAYLSYLSQTHLSDVLAKYVVTKNLTAVVCTHSESFMRITNRDSLLFLSRAAGGVVQTHPRAHHSLLKTIGVKRNLKALAYVEDKVAESFVKAILEKFDPELRQSIEIHPLGGEGNVTKAISANKDIQSQLKFVAIYDGDLRDKIPHEVSGYAFVLPGNLAHDHELKELSQTKHDDVCACLRHEDAAQILASLNGSDHHDWITDLANAFDTDVSNIIGLLFSLWCSIPENEDAAKQFCEELRAFVGY